ncbi:hypothetical protein L6252_00125, partial [Candidatus Parcubacteria bacterium]|nr:hypothetical protein [Candidatus Parcubacteria bacterium]
ESIKIFLEKRGLYSQNIYIVSNNFVWNKQGKAIAYKKPIVHTLNKGKINLKDFALDKIAQQRKTILLLGDSIDDVDMARPFEPKTLLKVGFLDFNLNQRLSAYKAAFDIVLLNNSPFDFINKTIMGYKQ